MLVHHAPGLSGHCESHARPSRTPVFSTSCAPQSLGAGVASPCRALGTVPNPHQSFQRGIYFVLHARFPSDHRICWESRRLDLEHQWLSWSPPFTYYNVRVSPIIRTLSRRFLQIAYSTAYLGILSEVNGTSNTTAALSRPIRTEKYV